MSLPLITFNKNKIVYKYDPNLDPILLDCSQEMYDSLVESGNLETYVSGLVDGNIKEYKKKGIRKKSNEHPGCALVYIDETDFNKYPYLIDILFPLVNDKRVKLIYDPTSFYNRFIYINYKSFKYFSENARYRIADLGGDLTITNKAILAEYLAHTCEKNLNIRQLEFVVPSSKEQALDFIAKHKKVTLTPLYEYCQSYTEKIIFSESQIGIPYSNNVTWEEYLYSEETDSLCPFMLRKMITGNEIVAIGSVSRSLDLTQDPINFVSGPDNFNLKSMLAEIITGTGISSTFFTLTVLEKEGIIYPINIDLSVPEIYLNKDSLNINATIEFAKVFNVALPYQTV
jgi:hypothetical protein